MRKILRKVTNNMSFTLITRNVLLKSSLSLIGLKISAQRNLSLSTLNILIIQDNQTLHHSAVQESQSYLSWSNCWKKQNKKRKKRNKRKNPSQNLQNRGPQLKISSKKNSDRYKQRTWKELKMRSKREMKRARVNRRTIAIILCYRNSICQGLVVFAFRHQELSVLPLH